MLYDRLVRASIGLEIFGVGALLLPIPMVQKLPICLFLHIVAVYSVAHWIKKHIPALALERHKLRIFLLITAAYILPPIGPVLLLLYADYLGRIELPEELSLIKVIEPVYFEMETIFNPSRFGEGGAYMQARNNKVATNQRIRALLALDTCAGKQKNAVMHNILFDEEDEIRLLAFGLLKMQEQDVLNEVHQAEFELAKDNDPLHKARGERRLAMAFWEMVYQDLALEDLSVYAVEGALKHAKSAMTVLKEDTGLWTLLGKIYLRQKHLNAAESAFKKALQYGAAASQVIPYLAELHFHRKDYVGLRKLLMTVPSLRTVPTFGAVYEFWHG